MDKAWKTHPRQKHFEKQIRPSGIDSFAACLASCKTKKQKTSNEHLHFFSKTCQFSDFPNVPETNPAPSPQKIKNTKNQMLNRIHWNPLCFPVGPTAIPGTNGHQLLYNSSVDLPTVPATCISARVRLQHPQRGTVHRASPSHSLSIYLPSLAAYG